jgi:predicted nucleic acid-binding protein
MESGRDLRQPSEPLGEARLMPSCFLDTNVFLYAAMDQVLPADIAKRPTAVDLVADADYGISGQVLAEFYASATGNKRSHRLSHDEAMDWLEQMMVQPCATVGVDLFTTGVALSRRYQISYWDGAILAAAHELGAETLYTEDLNHGQRYGDVTAVNPFLPASH